MSAGADESFMPSVSLQTQGGPEKERILSLLYVLNDLILLMIPNPKTWRIVAFKFALISFPAHKMFYYKCNLGDGPAL